MKPPLGSEWEPAAEIPRLRPVQPRDLYAELVGI
jgi:hypothetical protein